MNNAISEDERKRVLRREWSRLLIGVDTLMLWGLGSPPPPTQRWTPPVGVAQLAAALLIATFFLNLVERLIWTWKVPDTAAQQHDIQLEIAQLKRQAAALNTADTFAQSAKAERKAIALEKDAARLREQLAYARSHYLLTLPQTCRFLGLIGVLFLALDVPVVAFVRPEAVWPLGKWLALGSRQAGGAGAVGLLPWALLCHRVTAALVGR